MIIVCPNCHARYRFDESKLGTRPRARTRCAKCGGAIEIENPVMGSATLPPTPTVSPFPEPEATPVPPPPAPEPPTDKAQLKTSAMRSSRGVDSGTIAGRDLHQMGAIELPSDRRFSLAVIQGSATGQIFQIGKTRTIIGRSGADINLDDPECSRQHAVLEILGEHAVIRDTGSTNGTFVEADRVESAELANQMEFRIGSHVLMFIVTEVE
jgi:predicted Zn finger-like uncharacterized protein